MWSYLATLNTARQILWCYLIWYLTIGARYFDASPRLWLTSLGIAAVVGPGLWLSVSAGGSPVRGWALVRLFLMPFCVSSFAALVKGHGFVLVFSPRWEENAAALGLCALFLLLVRVAKKFGPRPSAPPLSEGSGSVP